MGPQQGRRPTKPRAKRAAARPKALAGRQAPPAGLNQDEGTTYLNPPPADATPNLWCGVSGKGLSCHLPNPRASGVTPNLWSDVPACGFRLGLLSLFIESTTRRAPGVRAGWRRPAQSATPSSLGLALRAGKARRRRDSFLSASVPRRSASRHVLGATPLPCRSLLERPYLSG